MDSLALIKQLTKNNDKYRNERERSQKEKFEEKLENTNFEQKYEKKRKVLMERMKEIQVELEKCEKSLELKNQEINDIVFDIEVLTNYENDTILSEKLRKSLNQLVDLKSRDQSDQDRALKLRMSYLVRVFN